MAVNSGSVSKQSASGKKKVAKRPPNEENKSRESAIPSPAKRNKAPGIRVVGGRVYDPVDGKTCHQCRQKTRDFVAACKSQRNNKSCPIMYCHKCLLNRYGEKAEEVVSLGEWNCPRCRGICNCSICMKKRGHEPTGILVNTAKATGYSSVSEMLLKGVDLLSKEKVVVHTVTSPKKDHLPGKENTFGGNVDANIPNHDEKKPNEVKEVHEDTLRKGNQEILYGIQDSSAKAKPKEIGTCGSKKIRKKTKRDRLDAMSCTMKNGEEIMRGSPRSDEKKPKKSRKETLGDDNVKNDVTLKRSSPKKLKVHGKMPKQGAEVNAEGNTEENVNERRKAVKKGFLGPLEKYIRKEDSSNATYKSFLKPENVDFPADVPLPVGEVMNSVAGIDLPAHDVGNALQFLEFCAVFGKIFDVKKGQPEYVLQDIFHRRAGRRGKLSASVQFHINLLSLLLKENNKESSELSLSHGKNSWFYVLKKCLSKSHSVLKAQGFDSLEKTADYDTLTASEKLRLLSILANEVLGTEKVRNWMDDQNTKLANKVKDAKQKVLAAKDKEKHLKQKMKDDIAQAILAKQGELSISEHEAIVSRIKLEVEEAQAEVLESKSMLPKKTKISDAVRIEPILVGSGGRAYWKLNCYNQSPVLHQNIGNGDSLALDEQWFAVDDDGKEAVEKHICSLRGKRLRALKCPDVSTLS